MPYNSVTLRPGVVVEYTPTLNTAGYTASQLGRFRAGLYEKLGGWTAYYPLTVGVPRVLHAWQDFNSTKRLAVGATTALTVITSGSAQTITPQVLVSDFAPDFTTTSGSATITITDTNISNVTDLDSIEFLTPVSVGGLILSGLYAIDLVVSATEYRITAASNATASVSNGGVVPEFTTTSGSATVSVALPDHGLSVGGKVVFALSTTVGGVTISGTYTVIGVASADVFSISVANTASSSTSAFMNSGDAELKYYIAIGPPSVVGTGWGVDGWGVVPWGGTGTPGSEQTGTALTTTDWTLDNWGQTLLASPDNGGVYQWEPGSGYTTAQLVEAAPIYNEGIFVTAPEQILLAYGCSVLRDIGVSQDPLTYAWSDLLDYTFWTPGITNPNTGNASQAGSNRIPTGSRIVTGLQATQQTLLWTDLDLWSINYVGFPYGFGQTKIGSNCGCISKHGAAQMNGVVYWWGRNNFYQISGGAPQVIPCSVWDYVFQDLDANNLDKCWIETITSFNEVWFFFPSASGGSGQCDSYVKFNVLEGAWDYGELPRAAGIDQSVLGNPIMATPGGLIYTHEDGYNADGQPMSPSFTTGYFMIAEGEDFVFVDQILPDFKWDTFGGSDSASIQITFSVIKWPNDTPVVYGPYTMTSATKQLAVRIRGRQMSITVTSADLNSFWRIGRLRYRWAPAGRLG